MERTASHTLTVREAAKLFEAAGVARTERSIVTWCQPNPQGIARLDAYFDLNDRRWFMTPESVERAIAEEQAKAARHNEPLPKSSEETLASEPRSKIELADDGLEETTELSAKLRDLEITTRVKDAVIKQLEAKLQTGEEERRGYIQQLIEKSHQIGSLETQLLQLSAPRNPSVLPKPSDATWSDGPRTE